MVAAIAVGLHHKFLFFPLGSTTKLLVNLQHTNGGYFPALVLSALLNYKVWSFYMAAYTCKGKTWRLDQPP